MDYKCAECDDRLFHWHCRFCRRMLTQYLMQCPACGIPDPTNKR